MAFQPSSAAIFHAAGQQQQQQQTTTANMEAYWRANSSQALHQATVSDQQAPAGQNNKLVGQRLAMLLQQQHNSTFDVDDDDEDKIDDDDEMEDVQEHHHDEDEEEFRRQEVNDDDDDDEEGEEEEEDLLAGLAQRAAFAINQQNFLSTSVCSIDSRLAAAPEQEQALNLSLNDQNNKTNKSDQHSTNEDEFSKRQQQQQQDLSSALASQLAANTLLQQQLLRATHNQCSSEAKLYEHLSSTLLARGGTGNGCKPANSSSSSSGSSNGINHQRASSSISSGASPSKSSSSSYSSHSDSSASSTCSSFAYGISSSSAPSLAANAASYLPERSLQQALSRLHQHQQRADNCNNNNNNNPNHLFPPSTITSKQLEQHLQAHQAAVQRATDCDDLDRIRNFIEEFKQRRGALGLTQKQAAQCFRAYTNDRYAFSDNFVGHFEGFQFRPQTAMTIADSLADWLEFAENETRQGRQLSFMPGKVKETRKRKYEVIRIRDSAKKVLVEAFEKNRSPSTSELELLSKQTNIPSRNIEIFFKNRRTSRQYHH